MKTISQRELRNNSAAVLRDVEAGESFTVTRRGVPVARIVPLGQESRGYRPPRRPARFSLDELVQAEVSSEEVIDESRGGEALVRWLVENPVPARPGRGPEELDAQISESKEEAWR